MPSTNIPAVKEAVLKQLEGAEALKGITISAGKQPERPNEFVWLRSVKGKREWGPLGKQPSSQNEMVRVNLWVFAIKQGGADREASEERAVEIFEAVEGALRETPTLGGVAFFQHVEELEVEPRLLDKKWAAYVYVTVAAKTRI